VVGSPTARWDVVVPARTAQPAAPALPVLPPVVLAHDVPLHVVRARVRSGRWTRVRPGAYVETRDIEAQDPGAVGRPAATARAARRTDPVRLALARMAAVVAQGRERGAEPVLVHASAALAQGLTLWSAPLRTHVARASVPGAGAAADLAVHRIPVTPDEIVVLRGTHVTNLVRTAVDIARKGDPRAGVVVLDQALRAGAARESLLEEIARHPGGRGVRTARELVDLADDGAESPWESWARLHALAAGLPRPVTQHPVVTRAGQFFPDLAWPEHRVAAEFDGRVKYTRLADGDPSAVVVAEKAREDAIRAEGWTVVRATADDLRSGVFAARLVAAFPTVVRRALSPRPHLVLR